MRGETEVTYITTSYNDSIYLQSCIDSVKKQQEYSPMHLIVLDGYCDPITDSLQAKYDSDKKIRFIPVSKNVGKSTCVNLALRHTLTKYIGLLDADDLIFPTKTKKQVEALKENQKISAIGSDYLVFNRNNSKRMFECVKMPNNQKEQIFKLQTGPSALYSSMIINSEATSNLLLDNHLDCAMDYDYCWNHFYNGFLANIAEPLTLYRIRSNSITRSQKRVDQLLNHARIFCKWNIPMREVIGNEALKKFELCIAAGIALNFNESITAEKIKQCLSSNTFNTSNEELIQYCMTRGFSVIANWATIGYSYLK